MATSAAARSSEPSGKARTDFNNAHQSPLRSAHEAASRVSTPRPSISPLSTASKPNRSPMATRDAILPDTIVSQPGAATITELDETGGGHMEDDDRSSSLSEPEDDQDEELGSYNVRAADANGRFMASRSLEIDSEAETERLENTPQKLHKHADGIVRTPSKLSQAAAIEDDLSDPPSPLPAGVGAASSTSTIGASAGHKRKRSDSPDSSLTSADSDIGESPRKRSHESPEEPDATNAEEEADTNGAAEEVEQTVTDTPLLDETMPVIAAKVATKGKKGKQKGRKPLKEAVAEAGSALLEDSVLPDEEQSEDAGARTEEEQKHKAEASSMFDEVAKQFKDFREKLYNERLASLTAELDMLSRPDCKHPEYLRQIACVDARRAKQVREANAFRRYRTQAIRERTLGDRAQYHSQYFQEIRRLREDVLTGLGEDWYNIQKERRQEHQEQDDKYIFHYPTKKSAQIRQQAKYNQEVSVLSGVAKYVGFPAAPEIGGANGANLEDDFKAMKIMKRVHQPVAHRPAQPTFYSSLTTVSAQNERLAHEQFIEQNAWAQPQRPLHSHGTPNLTHTPDWAEPTVGPQSRNVHHLIRNLSGQRTGSPYTTPLPQRRAQPPEHSSGGTVAVGSDGPEPPSSVAAAPPTSERLNQPHTESSRQTSPLLANRLRQQNGLVGERELTGYRNISNISAVSGASTIDAAPDSAERRRELDAGKTLPALLSEVSAPQQTFNTSHLHRNGATPMREVSTSVSFRPQEGAFGTPAPLTASNMPPDKLAGVYDGGGSI
ncbi:Sds3-like [Teratosphaeria destructans]|uniref:Sds3-like n=1 Tax=Teratosphaeria destructans TaxID=418781 RepID=A0A9W7SN54_9PEZI|nr:Sds3-like [Teratosphaeria destructans]